jgi:hypothetical protein
MAFNIRDFSANIGRYGTAPVNRFVVRIPVPGAIPEGFPEGQRIMSFRAEKVNIPGIVLDSFESRRYGVGPSIKTATGISRYNEISIDFIDTKDLDIKNFFYRWMNYIVDFSGNGPAPKFYTSYKADYSTTMEISIYNNENTRPVYTLEIVKAFPTSLTDSGVAWSRTNELFKTSVVFSYTHHRPPAGTVTPEPVITPTS